MTDGRGILWLLLEAAAVDAFALLDGTELAPVVPLRRVAFENVVLAL